MYKYVHILRGFLEDLYKCLANFSFCFYFQSFPAVTETMEFASISMMDVYNEVRGKYLCVYIYISSPSTVPSFCLVGN